MSYYEDRPWIKNYPAGIPANINPDTYDNILAFYDEAFCKYADKVAFTYMGKQLSFKEIEQKSRDFAAYLHSRGLEPGDKIAIMMPNILQYPIVMIGALRAGLVIVNTNPLYTPREMLHQFSDSEAKAVVIAELFASKLEEILDKTQIKVILTASMGAMLSPVKATLVNFVVRKVKKMVPTYHLPNVSTVKQALKLGKKYEIVPFESKPNDTVLLQYTGGTTGVSKGAELTNRNLIANMMQIEAWMQGLLDRGNEIALCPLPLYHIFAFSVNAMALFSLGVNNVLIPNARDIKGLIKEWKKHKVSIFDGVNTLFNALVNHPEFKTVDFSSMKITVGGGMAVQKVVAERWHEITGNVLSEGYGMTEASPVVTVNPVDGTARIGTIGLPVPSTLVRVADENDREVPLGTPGELQVKGPQVMKGYYKRPDETSKTIRNGWLCTGDIGFMDEDGYFTLIDRKKDMILVSGFNVFPNEIEDVIAQHPKVLEVAAIGVPDEKSGEVVKVCIVKKDKSLTEKELKDYCRTQLTGYKVPKHIEFRKDLPKSNVGKILRRKLREE